MTDIRATKFAQIIVDHSAQVGPGDRVAIWAHIAAEPAVKELFRLVLERGGYPHLLLDLPYQEEMLLTYASDEQLDFVPLLHKKAFEEFDVLIKIKARANTRELGQVPNQRAGRYQKMLAQLINTQMQRGAEKTLRWMSTQYPTHAYAMEADMGLDQYEDFFFRACHADPGTADPVAYWQGVEREQQRIIQALAGRDRIEVHGPNVDLSLSIKGRKFNNACGKNNLPDGEIYTGPVEQSANGWVRFTYPAIYLQRVVDGVELKFEKGRVVKATATKNESYLLEMLNLDVGSRYIGEFAIGTNFGIDRFTSSILLDEKIGGSFHMALGAGYPETGSINKSSLHWDMICDLRQDSEILADGEVIYRNGEFTI